MATSSRSNPRISRHAARVGMALLAALLAGAPACSLGTDNDEKPLTARVQVLVDAPSPLTLVVSTNFFETLDDVNGTILTSFNQADTFAVASTFDETIQLGDLGSIVARLIETADETATIEMRVWIDGNLEFQRTGTMRDATLEYKYVFRGNGL